MSSFFHKGILSILVSVFLLSSIVYAANTIIYVQPQSIGNGDTIAVGWYQDVNDSVFSQRNTIATITGTLNTLSGQVSSMSGQLNGSVSSQWSNYPNNTTPTGIYYPIGNVGIGVMPTDSSKKLVVQGDSLINGDIYIKNSANQESPAIRSANDGGRWLFGYSGGHISIGSTNYPDASAVGIYNGTLTPTLYATGGNVGIGTKNPIRSLHINPTTFQYSSEIVMEVPAYASNYRKWNMVVDAIGHTPDTASRFYIRQLNDAGTGGYIPLLINGSGNIGIGTNTPSAKLEVAGGVTKLEQETWKTPIFVNGWTECRFVVNAGCGGDTYKVGYMKDSLGFLRLKGLVASTAGLYGATNYIFQLPDGYRPLDHSEFITARNGGWAHILITRDGVVYIENYIGGGLNMWTSLDGIAVPLF